MASVHGDPNTRPSFYEIMWSVDSNGLRIPPDFKTQHLSNEVFEHANLRGPCGNFDVKLLQEGGIMILSRGWKEFVKKHLLVGLELLIFKYNGSMSFDVTIFDKNGTERHYESVVASDQDSTSSFTSDFPYFKKTMEAYNIGTKSKMPIPVSFSRMHFLESSVDIVLRNSEGICWSVMVISNNNGHRLICKGWKDFSDGNSLKKGDVCVFELIDPSTMQVHIIRSDQ